jgi:hypothetical protein
LKKIQVPGVTFDLETIADSFGTSTGIYHDQLWILFYNKTVVKIELPERASFFRMVGPLTAVARGKELHYFYVYQWNETTKRLRQEAFHSTLLEVTGNIVFTFDRDIREFSRGVFRDSGIQEWIRLDYTFPSTRNRVVSILHLLQDAPNRHRLFVNSYGEWKYILSQVHHNEYILYDQHGNIVLDSQKEPVTMRSNGKLVGYHCAAGCLNVVFPRQIYVFDKKWTHFSWQRKGSIVKVRFSKDPSVFELLVRYKEKYTLFHVRVKDSDLQISRSFTLKKSLVPILSRDEVLWCVEDGDIVLQRQHLSSWEVSKEKEYPQEFQDKVEVFRNCVQLVEDCKNEVICRWADLTYPPCDYEI